MFNQYRIERLRVQRKKLYKRIEYWQGQLKAQNKVGLQTTRKSSAIDPKAQLKKLTDEMENINSNLRKLGAN